MPRKRSSSRKSQDHPADSIRDVKELFDSLRPRIRTTVEQACASLDPHPQPANLDDFVEEIDLLLRENDYARLRSFRHDSAPETWLFTMAKRHIGKQLRRQRKLVGLDDLPPSSFTSEPDQEKKVILEEVVSIILDSQSHLTPGEKRLFILLREDKSDMEIAETLKIKKESVWRKKSIPFKKIRKIIGQDNKGK